jgi:hypothetical protein
MMLLEGKFGEGDTITGDAMGGDIHVHPNRECGTGRACGGCQLNRALPTGRRSPGPGA